MFDELDEGTVRAFRQKCTLEDVIGSHACSLEANIRVTNGIPLGSSLLLPFDTVNCVHTLKARSCSKCLTPHPHRLLAYGALPSLAARPP
jgi:hypothetical protein